MCLGIDDIARADDTHFVASMLRLDLVVYEYSNISARVFELSSPLDIETRSVNITFRIDFTKMAISVKYNIATLSRRTNVKDDGK